MSKKRTPPPSRAERLRKSPTGIAGFDTITGGGLPAGRPTLICGGAGCGKSLFAAEFLVRGAREFGEPGVLMTFEESAEDIRKNVASLGFNVPAMLARKQLVIDHVRVERSEIEENGDYDLEGLFVRLGHAIDSIGAKRVVLDTIEALFSGLNNQAVLRAELRRLFGWLKERGLTTVITGERGEGSLTRQGLEEYVSDCVILLDNRVIDQVCTRRLRVVKYRGTHHGTNEYPFLIDETGISVLPVTSSNMDYPVSNARISTGIAGLDEMLSGRGYYQGSAILLSGTAGTGKTSVAAHLVAAACQRGERCLFFSFEESPQQILRNMKSIGIDLAGYVRRGLLRFHSDRPTTHGLEMHLVRMHKEIDAFKPAVVVVDPLSNLQAAGTLTDSGHLLIRLFDYLRRRGVTGFFTSLTSGHRATEATDEGVSSIVDTWLLLRDIEEGGERNRALYVLKSRGMEHSNQIREFRITKQGVVLVPVYLGSAAVLTGSARLNQEAREKSDAMSAEAAFTGKKLSLQHRRAAVAAQIAALQASFQAESEEMERVLAVEETRRAEQRADQSRLASSRWVHGPAKSTLNR
jgi:circadian clock protein KaiC